MVFKSEEELRRTVHELTMEFVREQCRAQLDGRKSLPYSANEVATAYSRFYRDLLTAFAEQNLEQGE